MELFCILVLSLFVSACAEQSTKGPCHPCKCFLTRGVYTADCSNKGLTKDVPDSIPSNITVLDLSRNLFSGLPPYGLSRFKYLTDLNLYKNMLTTLHVDAFSGATSLLEINLRKNRLKLNKSTYPKGVFRDQGRLQLLDLSKNVIDILKSYQYPDLAFSSLTSLKTLYIDGVLNATFGKGFSMINNLRYLSLSGFRGYCSIYNLFNRSFVHTPSVTYLDISNCHVLTVDVNTFWPMRNIQILDLSDNQYLRFDAMSDALYGLQFSRLEVLKINRIVPTFSIGMWICPRHFRYLENITDIRKLYMDNNKVELVDERVMAQVHRLEVVSIKNARFALGSYLMTTDSMTNLKEVYFGQQCVPETFHLTGYGDQAYSCGTRHPCVDNDVLMDIKFFSNKLNQSQDDYSSLLDGDEDEGEMSYSGNETQKSGLNVLSDVKYNDKSEVFDLPHKITIPLPPKLQIANGRNSKLTSYILEWHFSNNSLKWVDLSYNHFQKWIGPIHKMQRLEYLDLSFNYCWEMQPSFLSQGTGLKVLNISGNFLEISLKNDTNGQLFFYQTKLETLKIGNNTIRTLAPAVFQHLRKLKVLDLSWNMMETWTADISNLSSLQQLDISKNRLERVPITLRHQIDVIMKNRKDTFHININYNNLKCACEDLTYLEWLQRAYIVIDDKSVTECRMDDGSMVSLKDLNDIVLKLKEKCKLTAPLIIGAIGGLFLFLIVTLSGIVYRYRWKLRYLYYTTRRKYRGYQRHAREEEVFKYDAFISFADEDRDFVVNEMRSMLEEQFNLTLCIHQRDFMVGEPITANIINAIQSSRKTVVVLSPHFLLSSWCEYEVRMARLESIHTGRDLVCVVWYTDVPDHQDITVDLMEELVSDTYIKYPDDEQERQLFWTTLKQSLVY